MSKHGIPVADKVFYDIQLIIIHSLLAVQPIMMNDKHCFECYGYDIIVDNDLKCWLVEVNASPSLSATTHNDRIMKHKLINDIFRVVTPNDDHLDVKDRSPNNYKAETRVGQFELMYDEVGSVSGRFADNFSFQNEHEGNSDRRNLLTGISNAKWR